MRYEGDIYSPHIKGDDYILQCTIGCSHNQCTFCSMYKKKTYRVRPLKEILKDIQMAKKACPETEKVFLADGDALTMDIEDLLRILDALDRAFPKLSYVGSYASARSIAGKSLPDLKRLRVHGLCEVHLGVESGDDEILQMIKKGADARQMAEVSRKIKESGISLFVTTILGLAGKRKVRSNQHALKTAELLNEIQPDGLGLLTVILQPGTELFADWKNGFFTPPDDMGILQELRLLLLQLQLKNTVFTTMHPSNAIVLDGVFPADKERLLRQLDAVLLKEGTAGLRKRETLHV